jgi:hypothetical protein
MAGLHQIFLLHGMGVHDENWGKASVSQLKRLYKQYPNLSKFFPFDSFFKIVPIRYDDIFDDLRKRWEEESSSVIDQMVAAGLKKNVVDEINSVNERFGNNSFLSTHLLDVLLYRFAGSVVGSYVRTRVGSSIGKALGAGETPQWSIIAHSLGTAVAHDALCELWGGEIELPPATTRPSVVAMISNVSRLLERSASGLPDVYRSLVRPGANPATNGCDFYINIRHRLDVIAMPKAFKPAGDWPSMQARTLNRYIEPLDVEEIAGENIHALDHYLENPKVHIPIFRALTHSAAISSDEEALAIMAYRNKTLNGKFDSYRDRVKKLSLPEDENNIDWARVVSHFMDFLR